MEEKFTDVLVPLEDNTIPNKTRSEGTASKCVGEMPNILSNLFVAFLNVSLAVCLE